MRFRLSSKLVIVILLAVSVAVALVFRIVLPYSSIVTSEGIKFSGNDAYYHMRIVDNLVHNFPHLFQFDPYFVYPDGSGVGSIHFFDWLLAAITWVIGFGSPSEHTIDVVGAYFPAVLGALSVVPVYFIGKELFGRWAGVFAAALVAVMPGEFMGRSILGFTDHHVTETLFTAVSGMFLIMAVKSARQNGLNFNHILAGHWVSILKPLIYSLLSASFLVMYIGFFIGALLFIFIIFIYFVIQFVIDHWRGRSTDYLFPVGFVVFFGTLMASLLVKQESNMTLVALNIALLTLTVLAALSWFMRRGNVRTGYYLLAVIGLGLAALGVFYLVDKSLFKSMVDAFSVFTPSGVSLTTLEMQPIFLPNGRFSMAVAWGNFTTGLVLVPIAFFILLYFVIKQGEAEKTFLLVWSLVMLLAMIGQRRFAYYFAVNAALLTGFLSWQVLKTTVFRGMAIEEGRTLVATGEVKATSGKRDYYAVLGVSRNASRKEIKKAFQRLTPKSQSGANPLQKSDVQLKVINEAYEVLADTRKRTAYDRAEFGFTLRQSGRDRSSGAWTKGVSIGLAVVIVCLFVFPTNIVMAQQTANSAPFAPSDGWVSSLKWLRNNTPEPFGERSLYLELEKTYPYRSLWWLSLNVPNLTGDPNFYADLAEKYKYPDSAYGVLSWWDYGYWISRIAQRIPNANPSQDPKSNTAVASFFTAQDESAGDNITNQLDTSYIVVDYDTATNKFWAVIQWAGKQQTDYFEVFLVEQEDGLRAVPLFYPKYYQSMVSRLYNFEGKAVNPTDVLVVSYEERTVQGGQVYKQVASVQQFTTYDEAQAYVASQGANYKIVSTSPFVSPIPLTELQNYKLIHSSDNVVQVSGMGNVPEVKIFQYVGPRVGSGGS